MIDGRKNNWASPSLKEVPFWREGMGPEEYEIERKYFYKNYALLVKTGQYIPLWKQKK